MSPPPPPPPKPSRRRRQAVAFFLALAAVNYSIVSTGTSNMMSHASASRSAAPLLAAELPYRPDFFHAIFALASMYLAMLFSSWCGAF
jgi:hypothetical protein